MHIPTEVPKPGLAALAAIGADPLEKEPLYGWGQGIGTGDARADFERWKGLNPGIDPVTAYQTCGSYWGWATSSYCWKIPREEWNQIENMRTVATPRPPTQAELDEAAETGDFEGLTQKLINEQLEEQKRLNAEKIRPVSTPPIPDIVLETPWWVWAIGAVGVLLIVKR